MSNGGSSRRALRRARGDQRSGSGVAVAENSRGIQTSGSGGAEAAEVGAEGLAGQALQGGGLLASSAKVSDPAARSPVQKQEMPARGSSGGTG